MKIFLTLLISVFSYSAQTYAIEVGEAFPAIEIAGFNKGQIDRAQLSGKVSIINFWATWCEACKVELKEMQSEFKDLFKEQGFNFSFVSLDKEPKKAEVWVRENLASDFDFMPYLYKDPAFKAADTLSVDSFPMTLIIGKDGVIKHIQRGFKEGEKSTEKLAEEVKKLLKS